MIKEMAIITGLSGAGKSNAVKIFEDMGFFCIDNLPGNEVIDFAGSTFSGNDTDIENKAGHTIDTAKATFE